MPTQSAINTLIQIRVDYRDTKRRTLYSRLNLPGKSKRAEARRELLEQILIRTKAPTPSIDSARRIEAWRRDVAKKALGLAAQAGINFDEHGGTRGSYRNTRALDYVSPENAKALPYCDMGGGGLGLVAVTRTTVYAKSSKWRPSSATENYLVGRNEAGTFFAHRVPGSCRTVSSAIEWIWDGRQDAIIFRQGDIALISGNGPKGLDKLPHGHRVEGEAIVHDTHPPIRLPMTGERIIVARRSNIIGNGATRETRD